VVVVVVGGIVGLIRFELKKVGNIVFVSKIWPLSTIEKVWDGHLENILLLKMAGGICGCGCLSRRQLPQGKAQLNTKLEGLHVQRFKN
jgi:hypothetical protein